MRDNRYSRRDFFARTGLLLAGTALSFDEASANSGLKKEPIIDIHQHIYYNARNDEKMIAQQEAMGITTTSMAQPAFWTFGNCENQEVLRKFTWEANIINSKRF